MTDLAGALQKALFDKLSAVSGLPPVVSEVPVDDQGQPVYPFTLLGDDQVVDQGSKDGRLERHEVAIHVCEQSTTKLAVRSKQALVTATLDRQPLTAPGVLFSDPRQTSMNTPLLEDGATYVGTNTFEIWAQPA